MNADILKRVVRAIADGSQSDLDRLADKIVEAERQTGHKKLADQLESILKQPRPARKRSCTSHSRGRPKSQGIAAQPAARRIACDASLQRNRLSITWCCRPQLKSALRASNANLLRGRGSRSTDCGRERPSFFMGRRAVGSHLARKRLAWNTGLPLMKVRFDALISSYFGESAANLRAIFIAAKERPCVLLLDECDFIARSRNNTKDIGEASRIVNSLLQLMEDYDAPGLLVATTNVESSLDSALFRRFDDVFLVPLPGPEEIEKLLR